jgi:hypothetical protein
VARYTLKTYYGTKQLERFDHRSVDKLQSILDHPRHHRAGQTGPFGEIEEHADKFEIMDNMMEKLFTGDIGDALRFIRTLR